MKIVLIFLTVVVVINLLEIISSRRLGKTKPSPISKDIWVDFVHREMAASETMGELYESLNLLVLFNNKFGDKLTQTELDRDLAYLSSVFNRRLHYFESIKASSASQVYKLMKNPVSKINQHFSNN